MKKIVLAGPPRSGKSCMREGLKQVLLQLHRDDKGPYPYVITACPDGEGAWFQETVNNDPEIAVECKVAYKAKFTPEFVERIKTSVENCSLELTLIDIGGIPSVENEQICSGATHMVILAGDTSRTPEWHEFAEKLGLIVVSEIYSDYHGEEDKVEGVAQDGILRGSVHYLERGEPVANRKMIQALAEHLIKL